VADEFDYDLFVIGAGSGGVRASRIAAQLGAKVAIAESRYLGGTCVNVGCVPKKLFVYASHVHEELRAAAGYGWSIKDPQFNWDQLRDNKNTEIARLNGIYQRLLDQAGVTLFNGHARIEGPQTISINQQHIRAKHIIIATGGWPSIPELPGSEHFISSNDAFYLPKLPRKIVIYGGGYVGVEFAGIFHGLGVETHLVYRGPLFLRGFDDSIREHLSREMQNKGIHCHFNTTIQSIEKADSENAYTVKLSNGQTLTVGQIMAATGRTAMVEGLGLENTKVVLTRDGQIEVDHHFQTAEKSIHAIGDVKGGIELTPVAIAEGTVLANRLFANNKSMSYDSIPTAIFSQPSAASVGLTEEQARQKYSSINIYESEFRHLKLTLTDIQERTYMKLIVDSDSDRVLGCHMVGQDAAEIVQGLAIAMKAGATKANFDATIGIHPSAAEEFVTMRQISRH
jgi:glutathione reductase (NADPH)